MTKEAERVQAGVETPAVGAPADEQGRESSPGDSPRAECGAAGGLPAAGDAFGRDARGRFTVKNRIGPRFSAQNEDALGSGVRRFTREGKLTPALQRARARDLARWIKALGGKRALSPQKLTLLELAADHRTVARMARADVDRGGYRTPRGRKRPATEQLDSSSDRVLRLLTACGLERTEQADNFERYIMRRYGKRRDVAAGDEGGEA